MAASEDEVLRPHGKECRERIEVARVCDDAGQQRLRTVEERLAPAASAARAEVAQEGHASPARVEVAQESRDEDSIDASSRLEKRQDPVEESLEDSTEVTSRMDDGNTPVGGPLASAEMRSRAEVFCRRGSEDQKECVVRGTRCLILKSLDVASTSGTVLQKQIWRCSCLHGFRAQVVNQVTSWMIDNMGQQRLREAEQRVSMARGQVSHE